MLLLLNSCGLNKEKINISDQPVDNMEQGHFLQAVIENTLEIDSNGGKLSKDDLAKFAESIGDARILGLGEQTHGAGSVFSLKTQLIKYLHEYHDFDVFILESGMFDVNEIWQQAQTGQRIKDIAPDNIFYMYAKTKQVTPLFDYINEQALGDDPLILLGFDSQLTGGISNQGLVDALTLAVEQSSASKAFLQWPLLAQQIQHVVNVNKTRFSQEAEQSFFKQLEQLKQIFKIDSQANIANSAFWLRITSGIEAQAKRQWQIADNRSKEMGENIKYWAEQYPNKKIIVWAHTWHLTRDGAYQTNAGQVVADAFGDQYYMAHFTGSTGEYVDFVSLENKAIVSHDNTSLEFLLKEKLPTDIGLLDLRALVKSNKTMLTSNMPVFSNDYQNTLPAKQWKKFFDGIFFIKKIKAAGFEK